MLTIYFEQLNWIHTKNQTNISGINNFKLIYLESITLN